MLSSSTQQAIFWGSNQFSAVDRHNAILTKAMNPGLWRRQGAPGKREKRKKISIAMIFSALHNHFKELLLSIFNSQVQKL